ncbi:MAG: right-handed parallel beta-helix repeat-containing protein [Kiritimatiellia bacterium]
MVRTGIALSVLLVCGFGARVGQAVQTVSTVTELTNAVEKAMQSNGDRTIVLNPGVYDLSTLETLCVTNSGRTLLTWGTACAPDVNGSSCLVFCETLTLVGADATHWSRKTEAQETILRGDGTMRLIYGYTGPGRASVFRNLTFENGGAGTKNGGAVLFMGTESIVPYKAGFVSNCVFRSNRATNGGAVQHINCYDSLFEGNSATDSGGAVYATSANFGRVTNDVIGCVFRRNFSESTIRGGGALWMERAGLLENCVFEDNVASNLHGGAVYVDACGPSSRFANCRFVGNVAQSFAGAFFGSPESVLSPLVGCTFVSNVADKAGAVHSTGGVAEIASCTFVENEARASSGGAILVRGLDVLTNCVFTGNRAHDDAGACCASSSPIGLIRDCEFRENTAGVTAGALWIGAAQDEVRDCRFVQNVSSNDVGALFVAGALDMMSNCTFVGNFATGKYGSVNPQEGYRRIVDCTFKDNAAGDVWAGVCVSSLDKGGTVERCVFDNNTNRYAMAGSQICYARQVTDCRFGGYGDMFAQNYDRCTFDGCFYDFENYGGGMICFDTATGPGHLRNCLFRNNTLHIGIQNSTGAQVEIANCTFVSNSIIRAWNSGGGFTAEGYLIWAFRGGTDPVTKREYPSTNLVVNCLFHDNYRVGVRDDVNFYRTDNNTVTNSSGQAFPACNILSNCLYETGSLEFCAITGGNVVAAPKFLAGDAAYPGRPYYLPRRGSPAWNRGMLRDWMVDAVDLAGTPRVLDGAVDIGCYECDIPLKGTMLLLR